MSVTVSYRLSFVASPQTELIHSLPTQLHTTHGDLKVEVFHEATPKTAEVHKLYEI